MDKVELDDILSGKNSAVLRKLVEGSPRLMRQLYSRLHHQNVAVREGAAKALGISSGRLERYKVNNLINRLIWSLNDESGNYCPHASIALREILKNRPELREKYESVIDFWEKGS